MIPHPQPRSTPPLRLLSRIALSAIILTVIPLAAWQSLALLNAPHAAGTDANAPHAHQAAPSQADVPADLVADNFWRRASTNGLLQPDQASDLLALLGVPSPLAHLAVEGFAITAPDGGRAVMITLAPLNPADAVAALEQALRHQGFNIRHSAAHQCVAQSRTFLLDISITPTPPHDLTLLIFSNTT